MPYDTEITKEFRFDAAHFPKSTALDPSQARIHGSGFRAEVTISSAIDPTMGWIVDFALLEAHLAELRLQLDHHTLNDIPGLAIPTLEHIATWIFERVKPAFPGVRAVTLHRDSVGERCTVRPLKTD